MGARMQPVTLAKRLERAMDENRSFSHEGVLVPNAYDVALHPEDFATFASYRSSLEDDLAHEVRQRARAHDYRLVARPWVRLRSDETLSRGDVRVTATMADAGEATPDAAAVAPPRSDTAVHAQADSGDAGRATLVVRTDGGAPTRFELSAPLISIGRDQDNDVIVDDPQVSRHHCQLKLQHGMYALTDLGSSNGSAVNGRRVTEQALRAGDVISIGRTTLEYGASA